MVEPDDALADSELDDDALETAAELDDEPLEASLEKEAWLLPPDAPEEDAASLAPPVEQLASANAATIVTSATASAFVQVPDCIFRFLLSHFVRQS